MLFLWLIYLDVYNLLYYICNINITRYIIIMTTLNFQTLEHELQTYEAMTEIEAIDFYNVENKAEALQYILDYWQSENKEVFETGYYLDFCYSNFN